MNTAAIDPAAVPGLTPAPAPEPEPAPDVAEPSAAKPDLRKPAAESVAETEPGTGLEPGSGGDADASDGDGPVFEASDRRGSVAADAAGVRLRLDDQEAEFGWDEIAAVEYDTSRFGRRFSVVVHTPNHRWYPGDVEAPSKAVLEEWTTGLDAVLDTYFND